ncbi:MAG: hypothetical protein WBM43_08150 [Flavobacteriaceae bacterium]
MRFPIRISILIFYFALLSCSDDEGRRNPYLADINFNFEVNLNLPLYSPLTNIGNAVLVETQGVGIRGVYVVNTGFDLFRAFEASCPNHSPNTCSTMESSGQVATCGCEDFEYNLLTGQQLNRPDDGERYYDMLEYRAVKSGNSVIISN